MTDCRCEHEDFPLSVITRSIDANSPMGQLFQKIMVECDCECHKEKETDGDTVQ